MRRKTLFFLCLSALSSTFLLADEHPDRGFYGSLDFLYMEDDYAMGARNTVEEKFLKELMLGYSGNIYSPRLLEYTVEGKLRFEDRDTTTDGVAAKEETTGVDYKTKFDFIKATKSPFTLYANKSERPVNTVYSAYATNYVNETRSEGATGSINFAPYIFKYGATTMKNITESSSSGSLESSQITNYTGSLNYDEKAHMVQVDYSHYIEENQQHYIDDAVRSLDREKDMLSLSYSWSGIEDLALSSGASYEKDKYFSSETINADLNLYWRPKGEKYDGSFSVYGSNMEYGDGIESEKYVFNSLNINQMLNYKLTESILLSENAMMYIYDATSVKGINTFVDLYGTHIYATTFFENIPFTFTTRLGAQKNDTNSQTTAGIGTTTTSKSVERYSLDLSARAKRELPSMKSTLSFDSGYHNSISSNNEEEQRYNLGLYFLSRLSSMLNNNISARHTHADRFTISYLDGEMTKNSYSTTNLLEMLDFYFDLGGRGRIKFGIGAEYVNMKNDAQTTSEINPRADTNMNYRLFNNWYFDASARVSEMYNTLDHSGNANLTFRAGKTSFLMGYQYNKSEIKSVFNDMRNERSIFRVQLTRTF